jgi:hypothetical protein
MGRPQRYGEEDVSEDRGQKQKSPEVRRRMPIEPRPETRMLHTAEAGDMILLHAYEWEASEAWVISQAYYKVEVHPKPCDDKHVGLTLPTGYLPGLR